jgi:L-ascorbate metabolism protein UlaG (beta-lactamase superfamily)
VSTDRIVYLGHALLIELQGTRLLTDPLLLNRSLHLIRRAAPVAPEHYTDIDAVLITHNHWDHLDLPSLSKLGRGTRLIVPHGVRSMLHRRGFPHVEELKEGDELPVGTVRVRAAPANHITGRPLVSVATTCLSYLVEGERKINFFGDTEFFPSMAEIADDLDIALIPVAGWGPTLGDGPMDPHQAVQALGLLRPRIAIPIHWGTFYPFGFRSLSRGAGDDPALRFSALAADAAPEVHVNVLEPGEALDFEGP